MITDFECYNYVLYLCKPDNNRTQIAVINYTDLSYKPCFRNVDQLEFDISFIEPLPYGSIDNPTFDLVKGHFFVQMDVKDGDNVIRTQYFVINTPSVQGIDVDKKHILAYSLEYMWNKKLLRGYKLPSGLLYDFSGTNGILNYIFTNKLNNVWSIGTVSTSLKNVYRTFDFPSSKLLEVVRQLEKVYSCVFIFHTDTYKVDIIALSEYGQNMGLYLSEQNYIKHIQKEEKFEQLVTRLFVYGKNNITIASKNINGQLYVDNFSAFRNLIYMSQSLLDALTAYDSKLLSNKGVFQGYLTQLGTLQTTLLTKQNELVSLNTTLKQYKTNENSEIKLAGSTGQTYTYWYNLEQTQNTLISTKISEITATQTSINTVNTNISTLNTTLSYSSNFTVDQLKELSNFIFEDTMTISEIEDAQALYDEAVYQVNKKATIPTDFSIDVVSFLDLVEGKLDWKKLNIGDYITVNYDRMSDIRNLVLRLVGYSHNPVTNSLQLEFSTSDQFNADYYYMTQMLQASQQTSNTVTVERSNYNSYIDDKGNLIYLGDPLNTSTNTIVMPDGSIIGSNGLQLQDSSVANSILRFVGDRLICSNDGGASYFNILDGNGLHLVKSDKKAKIDINPSIGFRIQKGDGLGTYTDSVYIDSNGDAHFKGNITGSIFQTAETGARMMLDSNGVASYVDITKNGVSLEKCAETGFSSYYGTFFYANGVNAGGLTMNLLGGADDSNRLWLKTSNGYKLKIRSASDLSISAGNGNTLFIGTDTGYTNTVQVGGTWNCIQAKFMSLFDDLGNQYVTTAWAAQKGLNTGISSHTHTVVIGGVTYTTSESSHSHTQT